MKHLANVLYVTTPEAYLSLDGENVVIKKDEHTSVRLPLHNIEHIVCFNWQGVSPALMGACAERHIGLTFLDSQRALPGAGEWPGAGKRPAAAEAVRGRRERSAARSHRRLVPDGENRQQPQSP
jgi:hypothetical protein